MVLKSHPIVLVLICVSYQAFLGAGEYDYGELYGQPEQIHLAYGESPDEMSVTWTTFNTTEESIVEYGTKDLSMTAYGSIRHFTDGGSLHRQFFIHQVNLKGLEPGQRYIYHCGSYIGWSGIYTFQAMKAGSNWSPRFAVYGDMGNQNPQSLPHLQQAAQKGHYDAILHVGDLAYNLETQNSKVGDEFMNQIQSIAAYIPYMTCVGNHESAYNFTHYRNRFSMPKAGGDGQNLWYSFDIGPAHIIAFSTEVYYYTQYGWELIVEQYKWLEQDLQKANLPENRYKRPWIITMGHKPMYCSNSNDPQMCTNINNAVRTGIGSKKAFGLEDLFYKYGVDLELFAHEHSYERLWPVYNRTICNGSVEKPYVNPTGPTHIITGSAGCCEGGHDPFMSTPFPWSAVRYEDYGYTRMNIMNNTHLHLEQVSDEKGGAIIDKITLVKEKHGAGTYTCHLNNK